MKAGNSLICRRNSKLEIFANQETKERLFLGVEGLKAGQSIWRLCFERLFAPCDRVPVDMVHLYIYEKTSFDSY